MPWLRNLWLGCLALWGLTPGLCAKVAWREVLRQPAEWYSTAEAQQIASTVLAYQTAEGGWPKNRDMTLRPEETAPTGKGTHWDVTAPTIDNGATTTQLRFLSKVYQAAPTPELRLSLERGLDYLLEAQYPNGGYPQFFPLRKGYYSHITFNDDAMVNVLGLLRTVSQGKSEFGWVDEGRVTRAKQAVAKGIECILRCQVVVNGRLTAWCAQHDENDLSPAPARAYEHISLASSESVSLLRFLMEEENPSDSVKEAIHSGIAWLNTVKISGLRVERVPAPEAPKGYDQRVVEDATAGPLWARFYEIPSFRPMFGGRDGVVHYALNEIELERRSGYRWYIDEAQRLLEKDWPRWKARFPQEPFTRSLALLRLNSSYPQATLPSMDETRVESEEDLIYDATVVPGGLALDLYRPKEGVPLGFIVFLHGGGWESGSRQMERTLAKALALRGWVTATVSYRLGAEGRFPRGIQDVDTAWAWLQDRVKRLPLDTQRGVVVGASAGGQMAAWLGAVNGQARVVEGLSVGQSRWWAAVCIDGAADFTATDLLAQQREKPSAPTRHLGGPFSERKEVWTSASPLHQVHAGSAPILFLNSTAPSPLLPGREEMAARLRSYGLVTETRVFSDTPHTFWLFSPWFGEVVTEIDRFLRSLPTPAP